MSPRSPLFVFYQIYVLYKKGCGRVETVWTDLKRSSIIVSIEVNFKWSTGNVALDYKLALIISKSPSTQIGVLERVIAVVKLRLIQLIVVTQLQRYDFTGALKAAEKTSMSCLIKSSDWTPVCL